MGKVLQFKPKVLTEYQECRLFWDWCMMHPICRKYMFHIPNEEKSANQRLLKARIGLRSGVSDYMLAYPKGNYHGLWIEMKRDHKPAKVTKEQQDWLDDMRWLNYAGSVCFGFNHACDVVSEYLRDES